MSFNFKNNNSFRNEIYNVHNDAKNCIKGKTIQNALLQGRRTLQMLDHDNKAMKTCISSSHQKLVRSKMRVTFNTDNDRRKYDCNRKVSAKVERLTKSQSNIRPDESHERIKKINGKKKTPKKVSNVQAKKTSSLTNFEKIDQFKKMHKLYTEGELKKNTISKEAVALIHAMHRNLKDSYQKNFPKPSLSAPIPKLHSKCNNNVSQHKNEIVKNRTNKHEKHSLKTTESKYDAVILNNICVMGKKLTLWKKIKRHFGSSTTTEAKDRSNDTISTVIDKKHEHELNPRPKTDTKALKSYSHSYFCYPLACDPPDCKWNITKVQNKKNTDADCACSKDAINNENITKPCRHVNLQNNYKNLCDCTVQTENNQSVELNACKNENKHITSNYDEKAAMDQSIRKPYVARPESGCNKTDCPGHEKGELCVCGEEEGTLKKISDSFCFARDVLIKQGKQIAFKVYPRDQTKDKKRYKRSIKTQVTVKRDPKHKQYSKYRPHNTYPCKYDANASQTHEIRVCKCTNGSMKEHETQLSEMSGDALRTIQHKSKIKHKKDVEKREATHIQQRHSHRYNENLRETPSNAHYHADKVHGGKSDRDDFLHKRKIFKNKEALKGRHRSPSLPHIPMDSDIDKIYCEKSNSEEGKKRKRKHKRKYPFRRKRSSHSSLPPCSSKRKVTRCNAKSKSPCSKPKEKNQKSIPANKKKGKTNEVNVGRFKLKIKGMKNFSNYTHINTRFGKLKRKKKKKKKKAKKSSHVFGHYKVYECDKMYMNTLRRRPYICVHYVCPWFYPHCISLVGLMRQTTRVFLFMLALAVWCPCLCALELCRLFICCLFCFE